MMKKIILASLLSLVLLVGFGPAASAQMAKEGTYTGKMVASCNYKSAAMGEERLQIIYECMGVFINDTGKGFLHNASSRALGALHAVKGVYDYDHAFHVLTCPDGDQVFLTHDAKGSLSSAKATFTLVGGTGKYTGIQGGGEWTWISTRPAAEGTFQGYTTMKGHWKLP